MQTDLTSGELSGALDKIATGFGNLVEKASEIIVAVLPKILEGSMDSRSWRHDSKYISGNRCGICSI